MNDKSTPSRSRRAFLKRAASALAALTAAGAASATPGPDATGNHEARHYQRLYRRGKNLAG